MINLVVNNFKEWRKAARSMLQQQILPSEISWSANHQTQLIFESNESTTRFKTNTTIKVPGKFMNSAKAAACYRDERRWSLLYSVLWRMNFEEPHLLHISTDPQILQLNHMHQAVNRDVHKMHAFVRFKRQVIDRQDWYFAWFEPSHLIVEYTADFFVRRFNTMNWSILTPDACVHWNQKQLSFTQGADKLNLSKQPHTDEMDHYWRQYYRHIFNPARLKTQAMQSEMPKKYWNNLPEAELIRELTQFSGQRTFEMLHKDLTDTNRLRDKSKQLRQQQDKIRAKHQ